MRGNSLLIGKRVSRAIRLLYTSSGGCFAFAWPFSLHLVDFGRISLYYLAVVASLHICCALVL
jgi:hypothetical protein